jgi:hypothetical protein
LVLLAPLVRNEFTSLILDKLIESGRGITVIQPLPDHPSVNQNYYLNFNVSGTHLSIHYDRATGGRAGHIHVTNAGEICRILILYDARTLEHFIGGCYENLSDDVVFITNICVDAIIEILFKHTGNVLTKKEICNM